MKFKKKLANNIWIVLAGIGMCMEAVMGEEGKGETEDGSLIILTA